MRANANFHQLWSFLLLTTGIHFPETIHIFINAFTFIKRMELTNHNTIYVWNTIQNIINPMSNIYFITTAFNIFTEDIITTISINIIITIIIITKGITIIMAAIRNMCKLIQEKQFLGCPPEPISGAIMYSAHFSKGCSELNFSHRWCILHVALN